MAGPGHKVPRGMKPTVQNPGKILKRLMGYVFRFYKVHMIVVFVCIIAGVLANLQGTMFMQELIDGYIVPMLEDGSRNISIPTPAVTSCPCTPTISIPCAR